MPLTHLPIHSDLKMLQDPKVAEIFKAKVGGKFAALNLDNCDLDIPASASVNS